MYYSLAREFVILLNFLAEMKRVLIFLANLAICVGVANGAVRDGTAVSRAKSDKDNQVLQSRSGTVVKRSTPRTATLAARGTVKTDVNRTTVARGATNSGRAMSARVGVRNASSIVARSGQSVVGAMSATRTGAEYERCKNTYFSCMDQFCALKNDDYRRCSCNDRVFELDEVRDVLEQADEKLTVFTENLEVVGMTAAQATAMRKESEGEAALTSDNSASKALLQAIMNSIRGEDTTVGGKYSDLNSINISFDTVNAFGMADAGQAIAAYNGNALYSAVYPQCREAVRADCNDASLQRAITAYLMAIEQDCNTVQAAIEKTQKQMKAAVREGGAMLDLARVENRQKHNASDITTCINEVESAILSEQVCGANYHKCLDNGQYIDVSTGKPIAGVEDFYKLEQMLVFSDGIEAADQKLSKNSSNRAFVQNFESRVKKFAQPALDKCVENADVVWSEYLDKAMLAIYYAQKSKVAEIKQGCFDFVAGCYMNGDAAITAAMAELAGDIGIVLQPDKVALNSQMCSEYVNSCNNMFDGDIIAQYIEKIENTDTLMACRAVVKQCFDKYGGTNYENFYYPYSGLFDANSSRAPDWFALYEYTSKYEKVKGDDGRPVYKSECAKQLLDIDACSAPEMIEQAFGGFDILDDNGVVKYGLYGEENEIMHRHLRSTGVATEVYNQILSILSTQCMNLQGRFMEYQFFDDGSYNQNDFCLADFDEKIINKATEVTRYTKFVGLYGIGTGEDMCPRDYKLGVATQSWGACICWENGARRSKWGKSAKCVPALPSKNAEDATCGGDVSLNSATADLTEDDWCISNIISDLNQVCSVGMETDETTGRCSKSVGENVTVFGDLPEGIE